MPLSVRLSINNIDETRRGLDRLNERISNFAPFWRSVAIPVIKGKLRDIFRQEGPGWMPLAPSTLRSRRFPGLPILQQTGALMDSVINHPLIQISQDELIYGTDNPYAPFHEHGTSRMPARSFLQPALNEAIDEIRRQYADYIRQQIRR